MPKIHSQNVAEMEGFFALLGDSMDLPPKEWDFCRTRLFNQKKKKDSAVLYGARHNYSKCFTRRMVFLKLSQNNKRQNTTARMNSV